MAPPQSAEERHSTQSPAATSQWGVGAAQLAEVVHSTQRPAGPQTGVGPPTFVFFTNVATEFHFSYERFLTNRLRESFGLIGTPIRVHVRKS